ncbi:MAG: phosphohydrolase [Candidatus Magasanikbacteria bacterium CG_4_9_14_0_2_um_filter_42_11]|uniref:Phosphohydrolase n=1 Tax=Candidatus Magasanikbacteria bacterium CG_4_9_14_0_2_um_filter_42_11 TaxID=1974643 RepID=A0A2M8F9G9_9BACT|nr:MAG: phosphohydrolase [Candidatus Magasanikbacteria bacterium CG10_big_fil_rev_8_21_14_0_10_43_9]PJC52361.1 MAG: phosphohydrolase [Candidatus Magasanikbacteria bacterium CG_4_9_14_0_2_um_filter_42_11]
MDIAFKKLLINDAREIIGKDDPSHDILHSLRVLKLVEYLQEREGGDLEVLVPSALLHDAVNPPKNTPKAQVASELSGEFVANLLREKYADRYTPVQIDLAKQIVADCSFSKAREQKSLEGKILQDADLLESIGAIAVMRTFCSAGTMKLRLYHADDPFAQNGREPKPFDNALDLFPARLFRVKERLHTDTAKELAISRILFVKEF